MAEREIERWITVNGVHVPVYKGESYTEVGKRLKEFQTGKKQYPEPQNYDDLVRMVQGGDTYTQSKSYKDDIEQVRKTFTDKKEVDDKIEELEEQLKKETHMMDDDELRAYIMELGFDEDDLKGMSKLEKDFMRKSTVTPKGKQIQAEINKLREKGKQIRNRREELNERLENQHKLEGTKEALKFKNPLVKAKQKSYEGFQLDTHTPYLQEKYEKGEAFIAEMSPKEYIQRCAHQIFHTSVEKTILGRATDSINRYAKEMREGTDYYMPSLDFNREAQEGLHRAMAAMINGYEKMPVMIVPKK